MSSTTLSTLGGDPLGDHRGQVPLKSDHSVRSSYSYELWTDIRTDAVTEAHQSFSGTS